MTSDMELPEYDNTQIVRLTNDHNLYLVTGVIAERQHLFLRTPDGEPKEASFDDVVSRWVGILHLIPEPR